MELFIDHKRGLILRLPWLGGGTEITACHGNGLGESPNHQIVIASKDPPRKQFMRDFLLPVIRMFPVKCVFFHNIGQPCLVGKEESEVSCKDAVFHVADHRLVLLRVQVSQQVVLLLISNKSYFGGLRETCCRIDTAIAK